MPASIHWWNNADIDWEIQVAQDRFQASIKAWKHWKMLCDHFTNGIWKGAKYQDQMGGLKQEQRINPFCSKEKS